MVDGRASPTVDQTTADEGGDLGLGGRGECASAREERDSEEAT
jgi:hypothetical protein